MKLKINIIICLICIIVMDAILLSSAKAKQRGLDPGEKMPEFSALDIKNNNYIYKHGTGKALMIMFISTGQQGSSRAASDINRIISGLGTDKRLETIIAVEDSNSVFEKSTEYGLLKNFNIVVDSEYKLWGKFGIIATPTVIISDANDTIIHVKAGHGYDFIPSVRAYINQVLGISQEKAEEEIQVKTITNDTASARVRRLLQMAGILYEKGRIESAIAEVTKAQEIDPNSTEVKLALAELLCRSNKSKGALDIIDKTKTANNAERAKALTLSGWANRQMGKLDTAEKLLIEATAIDPKSVRALFELGRIYQTKGQTEKAMNLYYKALAVTLGEPKEAQKNELKKP